MGTVQRGGVVALARALGWFSLGLGLLEVLAPRALSRWLGGAGRGDSGRGSLGRGGLVAAYGLREIGAGTGLLLAENKAPWLWARLAGDALDIATLTAGPWRRGRRINAGVALAAVLGVTALDLFCAVALGAPAQQGGRWRDYSDRRGLPRPPEQMRGAARDFVIPADMRTPEALRPWTA